MKTLALLGMLLTPAQQDALNNVVAEAKQWVSVYARVDDLNVNESRLRVNVYGRKNGDRFSFNGWIGNESIYLSGDKRGLWGGGLSVNLFESGSRVHVSGSYNFTLSKFGDGWSIGGLSGANFHVMKSGNGWALQGSIDERQHPNAAKLTAVVGVALAVVSAQ